MFRSRSGRLIRPSGFILLLTVCTVLATQLLVTTGLLENIELDAFDRQLDWLSRDSLPESDVVLVWIAEADIQKYGHPLSDAVLADAVQALIDLKPRVIGIDLYRDKPVPPGVSRLQELLTNQSNIIIVEKLINANELGVSAPSFMPPTQVGFSDIPLDSDGVVRRMFLMMWDADDQAYLSFALRLALRHLEDESMSLASAPSNPNFVMLGQSTLEPLESNFGSYSSMDAGGYQLMLDQRRRGTAIDQLDLDDLLGKTVKTEVVRDKTVILATSSPSVKDFFNTSDATAVYGGEIHARSTDQLLRHARGTSQPLGSITTGSEVLWLVLWCLLGSVSGHNTRNPFVVGAFALAGLGTIGGISFIALNSSTWLPFAAPGTGWLAALSLGVAIRSRQEKLEKEQMLQLFGRFVSRRIVSDVWDHREEFMDGERPRPQRAPISVMECDLSGFVAASATL